MPPDWPDNDQLCWVRRFGWYGPPIQLLWYDSASGFYIVGRTTILPWWAVSRWRPV